VGEWGWLVTRRILVYLQEDEMRTLEQDKIIHGDDEGYQGDGKRGTGWCTEVTKENYFNVP
jgi:hypothetical protein